MPFSNAPDDFHSFSRDDEGHCSLTQGANQRLGGFWQKGRAANTYGYALSDCLQFMAALLKKNIMT